MSKKFNIPQDKNILKISLEEAMPENYLPYAVEVAKDRALPDVRDGLKPVHRRILYGAHELKAFPDRPYLKSARIVGDILGKYHPHGDASVYDSMVIFAQDFSTREPLIDGHGNWGSQDGDNAAAMRYTEARLSSISMELLRDIDKGVVEMVDNYSDTEKEPSVLPARYPNLLVNGAFGIAVGLATNIPPHNLGEVIDGVIALSENGDITTKELMKHIKGPDLPTGGELIGIESILNAYETGKGRVTLRAKTKIEKLENGRLGIIITEFPYRKNKAKLLQTISNMTGDKVHAKALEAITDIRDESDRDGIRAVIEFKKSADEELVNKVLMYLYKKTDLQSNLSFNMVALVNGKPETLGVKEMLEHYLEHQKDVITRRTKRELEIAERRFHIVEGFIKAIGIMDEVIKVIRASKSKKDASVNLVNSFGFTEMQAEAILELMLYKLTGLEIVTFEKEYKQLEKEIAKLRKILESEKELLRVIKTEMLEVKEKYNNPRRSKIIHDESKAKIDTEELIVIEDIKITMSNEGYIKRIPTKSFIRTSGNVDEIEYREGDFNKFLVSSNTKDILLFTTNQGNVYQLRGIDIPEEKWREKGVKLDSIIRGLDLNQENIVNVFSIEGFNEDKTLMFYSDLGGVRKIDLFQFNNNYSKLSGVKVKKDENIIDVKLLDGTREEKFFRIETNKGLMFEIEEPIMESVERNSTLQYIVNLCINDRIKNLEIIEESNYEAFPISVQKSGKVKKTWGNNSNLRTYTDSSSNILIFTSKGNVYNIPAYILQFLSEDGIDLSNIVEISKNENVVSVTSVSKDVNDKYVYTFTKSGMIRKTLINEFLDKEFIAMSSKLKKDDELSYVEYFDGIAEGDIIIITKNGMALRFDEDAINVSSKNAQGVTAISLKEDDKVIFGIVATNAGELGDSLIIKTQKDVKTEVRKEDIPKKNRATLGKKVVAMDVDDYVKDIKRV